MVERLRVAAGPVREGCRSGSWQTLTRPARRLLFHFHIAREPVEAGGCPVHTTSGITGMALANRNETVRKAASQRPTGRCGLARSWPQTSHSGRRDIPPRIPPTFPSARGGGLLGENSAALWPSPRPSPAWTTTSNFMPALIRTAESGGSGSISPTPTSSSAGPGCSAPAGVALLRRMPVLWTEHEPAHVSFSELAATLGVPGGTGTQSRLNRTLDRLTHFGLAGWLGPESIGVYTEVAPLSEQRLGCQPEWTQAAHHRLVGHHLDTASPTGEQPQRCR